MASDAGKLAMGAALAGGGLLGVLLLARLSRIDSPGGIVPQDFPLPDGVTKSSAVVLTGPLVEFLVNLRLRVPDSIPLHVTSGVRTAEAQARALLDKVAAAEAAARAQGKGEEDVKAAGANELGALYVRGMGPQIVDAVLSSDMTEAGVAGVLRGFMAAGVYMSRHMRGDALDLRTRNLTSAQVQTVKAAAEALGASALVETNPKHLHLEGVT